MKLLLKHGANPSIISKHASQGPTPVFYLNKNTVIILPLLIKAGADINQLDFTEKNVLAIDYYYLRDTHVYKLLIAAGADWKNLDKKGKSVAELIISNDWNGRCMGEIKILLEQGADRKKIRKLAKKYGRKNLLFLLDNVWNKK